MPLYALGICQTCYQKMYSNKRKISKKCNSLNEKIEDSNSFNEYPEVVIDFKAKNEQDQTNS